MSSKVKFKNKNNNKIQHSKHVLYAGAFVLPDKNAAAHRVVTIGKLLSGYGIKTSYLERAATHISSLDDIHENNFKNRIRPKEGWLAKSKYLLGINVIRQLKRNRDIRTIILYNYHFFPTLILIAFGRMKGVKVVGDLTEWYNVSHIPYILRPLARCEVSLRMRFINKWLSGLVVISDYLYRYYHKYYDAKIVKIPPLIDLENGKWDRIADYSTNSTCSRDRERIKIFYAGSPGANKDDLRSVLDFVSGCRHESGQIIELLIAGHVKPVSLRGGGDIDELSWVTWLGTLEHTEVIQRYQDCDGLVLFRDPTRSNLAGFSTKVVEAITADMFLILNSAGFDLNEIREAEARVYEVRDSNLSQNSDLLKEATHFMMVEASKSRALNEHFGLMRYRLRLGQFISEIEKS